MPSAAADVWASGDAYEPYIGRWSRLVAREFLAWLGAPPGARWLDVGCGTGALTEAIMGAGSPARVQAVDPSLEYVRFARRRVRDGRAAFIVADAQALPQPPRSIDVAVSGLALNFVARPHLALAELARVARPGGIVAAYVWDYAGRMELIRYFWDAAASLDPRAAELDEAPRFPICHPDALAALFRDARLRDVETLPIDVPTRFRDFDDYWRPFLGGQGPAPGYAVSLSDECRTALRERIRAALPVAADGSIHLVARAWAVRGTPA
ncbi:MAG: Methyltransferase [Gemmatimonadetes bacterium]|nr:Methyltransferase [Gemmatimonadota bacterium]